MIWARTLATNAEPPWRYIPVRRTAIMIEQSIYNGIQWAVFEPNDYRLWSSLRVNVGAFMDNLFRPVRSRARRPATPTSCDVRSAIP